MNSSLIIPKKKDGKVWNETIPFNPLKFGWQFVKACCCEADFVKGDVKMKVGKEKNRVKFYSKESKEPFLVYAMPETQLEFYILQTLADGINVSN